MSKLIPASKWHLIQRASARQVDTVYLKKGIDRVLSFDYMGSAEFEFGALAESFKAYREQARAGNLVKHQSKSKMVNGKRFGILCHKDYDAEEIEAHILRTAHVAYDTKERTGFDHYVTPGQAERGYRSDITFWIVLGTGYQGPTFVMWSTNTRLIDAVYKELVLEVPTPVGVSEPVINDPTAINNGDDLRLFDTVVLHHKFFTGPVTLVGIFDNTVDVKLPNGDRLKQIKYREIRRYVAQPA